jgi:hypothetical protein
MLSGVEDVDKEILKNLCFDDLVHTYEVNNSAKKIMNSEDFLVFIADRNGMIPTETFPETISDYKILTNDPLRYVFDKLNNHRITVSDNIYQSILKTRDVKETDIFDVAMKERSLRVVEYIYGHSRDLDAVGSRLLEYSMENVPNDIESTDFDEPGDTGNEADEVALYIYCTKKMLVTHDCRKQSEEEKFLCQAITINPDQYKLVLAFMVMVPFPAQVRTSIQALTDEHCWVKILDHIEKTCNGVGYGCHIPRLLSTLYCVAENIGYTNLIRALDERLQ